MTTIDNKTISTTELIPRIRAVPNLHFVFASTPSSGSKNLFEFGQMVSTAYSVQPCWKSINSEQNSSGQNNTIAKRN